MQQAVTDTNILIAVMIEDDKNHAKALRIWENLEGVRPNCGASGTFTFLGQIQIESAVVGRGYQRPKVQVIENNID
ncbi:MAG TPA: hypothetical protein VJN71_11290, partial [Nitrososphaerales archaeon]|nr:hypothetical protein [Nitrososphaerales archaeon]